ncbi:MAG: aminopeptidase [Anaerolineales bacterium]|jgi:aminopeptidase|nr:aminopeptidase [Anaerolineales bacterium]
MTSDHLQKLDKYAEAILRVGLNLHTGQRLLIGWPGLGIYGTPIELAPLVRLIVEKAYKLGARLVDVIWNDDQHRLTRFKHAAKDTFEEFPTWRANAAIESAKAGDAMLVFYAEDPDLLIDQDVDLISTFNTTISKHMAPFSEYLSKNFMNWTVVTAPIEGWTEKVFPGLPADEGEFKFWDTIFEMCRINQDDPVKAWKDHIAELTSRSNYLNHKQYVSLKLTAPGTDLMIGLPMGHIWRGGQMTSQNGIEFTANLPTEEIFTTPHRGKTEGSVTLSKPLHYGGSLVEELRLTFAEGRLTKMTASKGEEYLHKILKADEGANRLGEVALVPHSSPISRSGLLFYNILLDENASNHIALGRAYRFGVEGGEDMSDAEFAHIGGNDSVLHIDCMIGSDEMDIDGVTSDGASEPLMHNGEWAFEL